MGLSAQELSVVNLKGQALDSLRKEYLKDHDQREQLEKTWHKLGVNNNNKELVAFVEVMKLSRVKKNVPQLVEKFSEEIGKKYKDYPNIQAMAYQMVGYHYFIGEINYEKAFAAYVNLEKLLDVYGPKTIGNYADYCAEIASAYYKFRNYKKAIEMGKKGVSYAANPWDFYNTIGLCLRELHQLDSAIYYLNKAVDAAISKKARDIYRTISLGNIGYCYYLKGQYLNAKPLLQVDLQGALHIDDKGLAAGAEIPLADIYLKEKNLVKANQLLDSARSHIAKSNQLDRLEKYYPVRSRYYQLAGNVQLALAYRDSVIRAIKRNDSIFNSLLVLRVQQRTDMEKLAEERGKLENYKKLSQTRIIAIIVFFILLLLIFFLIRRYRGRIEKDRKQIEELNRMMELRQRLSADMHDDIGSTLSSISIYTHSLLMQSDNVAEKGVLEKIKQNAQNVQENLGDIIWSVNPNMDSMEQIISRMRAFGADMTEHAGIALHFEIAEGVAELPLNMMKRKNLYLIYKEAVNNAVKYSGCSQLNVSLQLKEERLVMEIVDHGKGFDTKAASQGNGLRNMHRRAKEINGELLMNSTKDVGTSIALNIGLVPDS